MFFNLRFTVLFDFFLASNYHQETWNPNWNLRTLILSLRGFMTTKPVEIGSITTDPPIRREYANQSLFFNCTTCGLSHAELSQSPLSSLSVTSARNYFGQNELTLKNLRSPAVSRRKTRMSPLGKIPKKSSFLGTVFKNSFLRTILFSFPFFVYLCTKIIDFQFTLRDTY
jgi:hypothetical protein